MKRSSGVLMSVSSLPSPHGIGTLGDAAYHFIDFLASAGQRWWQVLPLGPTSFGDSPYASPSSFAGNPYYIDLDYLVKDHLLNMSEIEAVCWGTDEEQVDYGALYEYRFSLLRTAFGRVEEEQRRQILAFRQENRSWIENYALFMSLKTHFSMKSWTEWPEDIRLRKKDSVDCYSRLLAEEMDFWVFTQYLFFSQWDALRSYAREKGIGFIGDIPIYVAMDSADIWAESEFFQLDGENLPVKVSGVPPDDYTPDGQLWGNPLYDWDKMKADGYGWWIRRIDGASRMYDVLRIDHFRGLASYWSVPYGESTARKGVWCPGPGIDFVHVLTSWFNRMEFIAEDLGYPTPEVSRLLADSRLPGMNVLQFAFDPEQDSVYLPHNMKHNSVCYIGTHDNPTALEWIATLDEESLKFLSDYTHHTEDESWCRCLLRTGMAAPSRLFIMTMQDLLELPGTCRMNTPGTAQGNWRWRMKAGADSSSLARELSDLTRLYRRMELTDSAEDAEPTEKSPYGNSVG